MLPHYGGTACRALFHPGSRSQRGADVAALFYTLFETAKLSGVDPRAYVRQAATRAVRQPGTATLPNDLT